MKPDNNTSYVLTTVNLSVNPPDFKPNNGRPVNLIACANCGFAYLSLLKK